MMEMYCESLSPVDPAVSIKSGSQTLRHTQTAVKGASFRKLDFFFALLLLEPAYDSTCVIEQ